MQLVVILCFFFNKDYSTIDKCNQKELIEKSGVVIKRPIDFVSEIPLEELKVDTEEKVKMTSSQWKSSAPTGLWWKN